MYIIIVFMIQVATGGHLQLASRRACGAQGICIMPGYQDYSEITSRFGKHRLGKSCLYVNKLADIDLQVLRELIVLGLKDLAKIYPVTPS